MSRPFSRSWQSELETWLLPFLEAFGHKARRRWAPYYIRGLLGPGRRKSVEPLADRVAPGEVQQLHHFVSTSRWATDPVERVLVEQADALVGGEDAFLIVDDTALVKKGSHSVGVARQWCGQLGKRANCQVLVSLTLARGEVPVCVGLKLFLPQSWAEDRKRRAKVYVPEDVEHRPKWQIALEEIDRIESSGAQFGAVLADAGYGMAAGFRRGLSERSLRWAVGILPTQKVYPADVRLRKVAPQGMGRRRKHREPDKPSLPVSEAIESLGRQAFRSVTWRRGTKGPLRARFACARVRVADGPLRAKAQHQPGAELWAICEQRPGGERKYYLSNLPPSATRKELAATIKARWVCEQAHQQMKQELGLNHFEGRSWHGLHHHALLSMIAFAFLQHVRLREKKHHRPDRTAPADSTPSSKRTHRTHSRPHPVSHLQEGVSILSKRMKVAEYY